MSAVTLKDRQGRIVFHATAKTARGLNRRQREALAAARAKLEAAK